MCMLFLHQDGNKTCLMVIEMWVEEEEQGERADEMQVGACATNKDSYPTIINLRELRPAQSKTTSAVDNLPRWPVGICWWHLQGPRGCCFRYHRHVEPTWSPSMRRGRFEAPNSLQANKGGTLRVRPVQPSDRAEFHQHSKSGPSKTSNWDGEKKRCPATILTRSGASMFAHLNSCS